MNLKKYKTKQKMKYNFISVEGNKNQSIKQTQLKFEALEKGVFLC